MNDEYIAVVHTAHCRGCEWYNDKAMDVTRECDALDHIFCEQALKEHDAMIMLKVLDDVRKRINDYLTDSYEFGDFAVSDSDIDLVINDIKEAYND